MLATPVLVAYLHLSAHAQGLANQKPGVLKYCAQHGFGEPLLIEYTASGKVDWQKRKVGEVLLTNPPGSRPMPEHAAAGSSVQLKRCNKDIIKILKVYLIDILFAAEATAATVVLPDHSPSFEEVHHG